MAFAGINIAMGIVSQPELDHYWYTDPVLSRPCFQTVMSSDSFREIWRYIHVVDDTLAPRRTDPDYDKIRPIISALE